jgi:HTH-type transcriptional regulator / antitoxin HigA
MNIDYRELVKSWSILQDQIFLKSIRNEDDHKKMVALATELSDHLEEKEGPQDDLFHIVIDLIYLWESREVDVPSVEPREVLRYLLEAHNLKQKDLADIASSTLISDILSGRRAISKNVAKALSVRFNVDVSAFI